MEWPPASISGPIRAGAFGMLPSGRLCITSLPNPDLLSRVMAGSVRPNARVTCADPKTSGHAASATEALSQHPLRAINPSFFKI